MPDNLDFNECLDCGETTSDTLKEDPREPPLSTEPCLCEDCYYVALVDAIDEGHQRIEELEQLKESMDRDYEKEADTIQS
jgi:hypothetical protein